MVVRLVVKILMAFGVQRRVDVDKAHEAAERIPHFVQKASSLPAGANAGSLSSFSVTEVGASIT
ncbi:hypothetical protein HMSSN036_15960 [Paenibacillus macerans]|nr:hypothetical protein HMSSN036_15960 [Paenibacillus macerans]